MLIPSWQYRSEHFFKGDNPRLGDTLRQGESPARRHPWELVFRASNLLRHGLP